MDTVITVLGYIFWGVLTFSLLVFVHEGGHFLAARACGVRVSEFFLGMPFRYNLHHVSKRIGTKFGITPLLLGGYAKICGMEHAEVPCAPSVLTAVHRHGVVDVATLAAELDEDQDAVLDACVQLMDWGSVAPVYREEEGEHEDGAYYPLTYAAMPRDAAGNTIYDGRSFDRGHATREGEPWTPPMGEGAFFERERSRTYLGKGFWQRALMLLAGIAVNIFMGFLVLVIVYAVIGYDVNVYVDTNTIGGVTEGSPAEELGLAAGDTIISINGQAIESWTDISETIGALDPGSVVEVVFEHEGTVVSGTVELDDEGLLGVSASYELYENYRFDVPTSIRLAWSYVVQTAEAVIDLLVPSQTMEVLENSTSIVGISVMSSEAAASGASTYLAFVALISFSLGFMNLLPIPPLDGGKLVIEVVQAVSRREVPVKVQNAISYAGLALFCALFVYLLQSDITRFL